MEFIVAIFVFGLIFVGIYFTVYTMFDHWTPKTGDTLRRDAKVVDFKQRKYNKYKFESTVLFDDGFKYVSYKTKNQQHAISITVYTTKELNREIVEKAVKKHAELLNGK